MAVTTVKRLDLVVHKSVAEDVVADLQHLGFCEQIQGEDAQKQRVEFSSGRMENLDALVGETRFLLRFLEPHFVEETSGLARFLSPKPTKSLHELSSLVPTDILGKLSQEARDLERKLVEIRTERSQIDSTLEILHALREMQQPLGLLTQGTHSVTGILGTVPVLQLDELRKSLEAVIKPEGELFVREPEEKDTETWIAAFYLREQESFVLETCGKVAFSRVDLPGELQESVVFELNRLAKQNSELERQESVCLENIGKMAQEWVEKIRYASDYFDVLQTRYQSLADGNRTEKIVFLEFWIPEDCLTLLSEKLKRYERLIDITVSDPDPDEHPPVLLENPGWAIPFEPLTRLYGAPHYGAIDPTTLMAPFFFLFFGMCLGDAGYGLLMVLLFLGAVRKYRMEGDSRNFFVMLGLCGISTIAVGIVTGTFFGNLIDSFSFLHFLQPIKDAPVLLDPMKDPITFLLISLALGVIQILFGLGIALYDCLRKQDYIGAFADQGGWILLIIGLLLFGGAMQGTGPSGIGSLGKFLSISGALTLVLTQGRDKPTFTGKAISGVLSLYNVTSYLGDVLSYSRLLALGLATSAVGMIVNMLSGLVGDVPYVGWLFGIVLFLGGHVFSILINVLGAFVHSLRLQYVEFFSKFYSSGGKLFSPLRFETRYVTIGKTGKK